MNIKPGLIKLNPVYEFVSDHREIPHRTNDRDIYDPYRKLILSLMLISNVPKEPGWYVWFNRSKVPPPIYIGKSSKGKTSHIYARLKEELLEDYVAFWLSVDEQAAEKLSAKYNDKYNQKRASRKRGTDSIVWISCPDAKDGTLDVIEYKLIQNLKPTANIDTERDYSDIKLPTYNIVESLIIKAFNDLDNKGMNTDTLGNSEDKILT